MWWSVPMTHPGLPENRPQCRGSGLPPDGREPRLLVARQSRRAVVVVELDEARRRHVASPRREIVPGAVALTLPTFGVGSAWVRREEDAARPERRVELAKDARQLLRGNVEERGVGEDPVEARGRQVERQEVRVPDVAPGGGACHGDEARRAVEADRLVARARKRPRSRPGPQPRSRIENGPGPSRRDRSASTFWPTSWSFVPSRKSSAWRS